MSANDVIGLVRDDLYLEFFNLREHPFGLTPDADFLYLSAQHARAKACMEQTSVQRDALAIVTGEVGCGKSTLVNRVVAEMPADTAVARLTRTNLDSEEFLQSVLSQFGFKPFDRSKSSLVSLLDNFLFAQNVRERPVVLIVEEAQNLSHAVLKDVCALADWEDDSEKRISIILVGQPSLRDKLAHRDLQRVVSRARCTVHLDALSQNDTIKLIEHRLSRAGATTPLFDEKVLVELYRYTGGVPRLVINLCDTALTAAFVEDSNIVTMDILHAAIAELKFAEVAETETESDSASDTEPRAVSLTVFHQGKKLEEVSVSDTRLLIGRDSDNDVVLQSEFVSRHHAQVIMDHDGRYWIKDLNSTNGVYLNGRKTQRGLLHDRDQLIMGRHELIFSDGVTREDSETASELADWRNTSVLKTNEAELPEEQDPATDRADSA